MSLKKEIRELIVRKLIDEIGIRGNGFSVKEFANEVGLNIQTIYRMIQELIESGKLIKNREGNKNTYTFVNEEKELRYKINGLEEDVVWKNEVRPFFYDLPEIPLNNLNYAFTEILNNAIDHSGGSEVEIILEKTVFDACVTIWDNGIGIFRKIAEAMGLEERSFAILELAKGKFTTEPESHSGEGIFFSSKVVDTFSIYSDKLLFVAKGARRHGLIESSQVDSKGTYVFMQIRYSHNEPSSEVFNRFTLAPEDYGFSKTIVPVRLLEYGDDSPQVVSRSQAKRLMVRFERFENIILDFDGIDEIGQGFADELFRVFASKHPNTKLLPINTSEQIEKMIRHVISEEYK